MLLQINFFTILFGWSTCRTYIIVRDRFVDSQLTLPTNLGTLDSLLILSGGPEIQLSSSYHTESYPMSEFGRVTVTGKLVQLSWTMIDYQSEAISFVVATWLWQEQRCNPQSQAQKHTDPPLLKILRSPKEIFIHFVPFYCSFIPIPLNSRVCGFPNAP